MQTAFTSFIKKLIILGLQPSEPSSQRVLHFGVLFALFFNPNYKVEEDEVGGACGTNGGEEEHV
jgi:hypothetical protein